MSTAGDGRAPYETGGAGGKFRKKPFRRSCPATPYDRPPTALRNNNPSLLTKLVDPASRLIYAGAHKLFGVFRKRLPPLSLQRPPEIIEEPPNVPQEIERNNSIGVSEVNTDQGGISELEQMLKHKTFTRSEIQHLTALLHSRTESPSLVLEPSTRVLEKETTSPAELGKSYMISGSRATTGSQTLRQDTKTPITPKIENGFLTPRSRGRSAMYSMARTPYTRSPLNFSQKGTTLAISQSPFDYEGKTALKRRSSVLEDDFGSGGPLRRIRQKNSSFLRDKKELGYITGQKLPEENGDTITRGSVPAKSTETANKIMQQLERLSPKGKSSGIKEKTPSKLTLNMLHGQALRSVEKVDSPKFLPSSNDVKKLEVQHNLKNKEKVEENGESSYKKKEKVEESGGRKFPVPCKMLTNGDLGKDSAQIVAITDLPLKVLTEPPQKKRAFQMSAPEDTWELDDDIQDSIPPVETTKPETTSTSVPNTPVSADIIIQPTPLPETAKPPAPVEPTPVVPEVAKIPEKVEFKEPEKPTPPTKTEIGFKFPSSSSTITTQIEKVTPEKTSPFQFSGSEIPEFKSKPSPDPKVDLTSDQLKVSKDENGNNQKSEQTVEKLDSFPANIFSFGNSQKSSTTPTTSPASTAPIFSSIAPFSASSGNNNNNSSDITPATTTSISIPPPVFGFGSTAPTTSVPEKEKEPKSVSFFATTTTATTATTSGGLFGFSAPAATSTTATTTSSGLFGFSAPAATSTTTASGLFGFSAPAAISTTTTTAATSGSLFGFSAPSAISTTTTAAATSGGGLFGFSSPAAISTTTTTAATSGGGLFGFSSPAATSPAAAPQSQSSFFNATSSSQANTQPPPSTTATFQFGSGSSTAPTFGITPENKSGNSTSGSTTNIFGSSTTWQQPPPPNPSVFSFGASSAATSPPITFGAAANTTPSTMFSFSTSTTPSQVFGTPTPVFANNNDQMSMEDSMAEDSMQSPTPVTPFSQTPPPTGAPGFLFGTAAAAPPQQAAVPFQFGGGQPLQNQAPPPQNPFQSSSVEFNAGGGSFSLGSGGGDKSGRRIVRVNKNKNRRK